MRKQPPSQKSAPVTEDPAFLQEQIITYLGNKRTLLPFIGQGLQAIKRRLGKDRLSALDLFSGSGVVARYLKQHCDRVIANDLEAYSRVSNQCYLTNRSDVDRRELGQQAGKLRARIARHLAPGLITELYAPPDEAHIRPTDRCFYTRRNAMFLDTAVQEIARLPAGLRHYFLAPLLSRASVHANTSGVFKGFYKNAQGIGQFGGDGRDALQRILGLVDIDVPVFSAFECATEVHQADANELVPRLPEVDVAYFDPPYNQHPYGSNYFMLNLLVNYRRPEAISRVSGIPTDWNRSKYNQRRAAEAALFSLVQNVKAKFVLISYNSEGFISYDRFLTRLAACGEVSVIETSYNAFRGSRNLRGRALRVKEFLYLVEKK